MHNREQFVLDEMKELLTTFCEEHGLGLEIQCLKSEEDSITFQVDVDLESLL